MAKKTAKKPAKRAPKKASKKTTSKAPAKKKTGKKRGRPTDANLIKNLEARIKEVKDRIANKNKKDLTHVKSATRALKAIGTAMAASKKAEDAHMRIALADGYRAIAAHFKSQGYKTPKISLPRGRRPK
jgi:hypothetical protein